MIRYNEYLLPSMARYRCSTKISLIHVLESFQELHNATLAKFSIRLCKMAIIHCWKFLNKTVFVGNTDIETMRITPLQVMNGDLKLSSTLIGKHIEY